jgi:hypothetical protein
MSTISGMLTEPGRIGTAASREAYVGDEDLEAALVLENPRAGVSA